MRSLSPVHRGVAIAAATAFALCSRPLLAQPQEPPAPPPAAPPSGAPVPGETPQQAPTPPPETPVAPTIPAEGTPPAATSDETGANPSAATAQSDASGAIVVSVRISDALLAGVAVLVDGQPVTVTGADAPVQLTLPAGAHTLHVDVPASAMPERADQAPLGVDIPLNVAGGQSVDVVLVVNTKGEVLSLDLRPTVATDTAPEPAPEEPTGPEKGPPGKLTGRVILSSTRQPIVGAKVYVRGTSFEAVTDANGLFSVDLPQGSYDLAIVHPDYATALKDRVRINVQKTTTLQFELTPSTTSPDDFTITAKYVRGGVAALLEERRNATTVQDAIGAEDIAKSPDSTASSATRRVVGASIVGGQFLLVRGLGGRYSNVRLNGVPLPSTDPDLPGFQIDLFPASLLSNLTITKTFSADIPGDFAGGSLNVVTKDFPEKFTLGVSVGAAYNTETTFRKKLDYDGGSTDLFGFDDGTRALPDGVPNEKVVGGRNGLEPEQIQEIGKQFPNHWKLDHSTAPPNLSLSASLGDTTRINDRKLGYLFTLGYRANFQRYVEDITSVKLQGTEVAIREQLKREVGEQEAQIGVLGTASYEPAQDHKLTLVSLITQTANDRASLVTGIPESVGTPTQATQFRFVERQLLFNQLLGEHKNLAGPLKLNWQLNMALVSRDQPDTRDVLYGQTPDGFQLVGNAERLYTELGQTDFGGGTDLTFPVAMATGKVGYLGRLSSRDFSARHFSIRSIGSQESRLLPPEQLFDPSNFGEPDPSLLLTETSSDEDGYVAEQNSHAGYVTVDVPAFEETLRVIPGLRVESFHQKIESRAPFSGSDAEPTSTKKDDLDWLPAGALVVNLSKKMAVRGAYGGTVARPLTRELSPFLNQDYVRRRTIQGNPDLTRTFIHNFDLRWELFPSGTEVFAASAFYKIFQHPIESVVIDTNANLTLENIKGARNYGLELESRFSLERFSDALKNFSVLANLAIIQSRVELSDEQRRVATSQKRPLAGQSPYVANLSLGYSSEESGLSANVYYNVFGRRLQDVGQLGLPDVYEEPFHSVDVSAFWKIDPHWTVSLSGTNVLVQPTVIKQGEFDYSRYNKGSTYGAKLAWNY